MYFIYVLVIVIFLSITLTLIIFKKTKRKSYLYAIWAFLFLLFSIPIILTANKIKSEYHPFVMGTVLILYTFTILLFVKSFLVRKKEGKNNLEMEVRAVSKQLQQIIEYSKKCRKVYGWKKWRLTFKINSKNIEKKLLNLKIADEIKNEIRNEVVKGKTVIISEVPFQIDNWVGEKYLIIEQ